MLVLTKAACWVWCDGSHFEGVVTAEASLMGQVHRGKLGGANSASMVDGEFLQMSSHLG